MKPNEFMARAERAVISAKLLLDNGDKVGACDRAYYAMFDAARAALLALNPDLEAVASKTHNGLMSAFSLHVIKLGRLPVELGKAFNRAEELRLVADYSCGVVTDEKAQWVVGEAGRFVDAIRREFLSVAQKD